MHPEGHLRQAEIEQLHLENRHRAGFTLHFNTLACQLVEALTLVFQGRVHRRDLLDITDKPFHRLAHIFFCDARYRSLFKQFAFGIARGGSLPQLAGDPVVLVGIQQETRYLGCLAKTDRQQSGGQRIKTARMACLARTV